jgi:hypothetical protein
VPSSLAYFVYRISSSHPFRAVFIVAGSDLLRGFHPAPLQRNTGISAIFFYLDGSSRKPVVNLSPSTTSVMRPRGFPVTRLHGLLKELDDPAVLTGKGKTRFRVTGTGSGFMETEASKIAHHARHRTMCCRDSSTSSGDVQNFFSLSAVFLIFSILILKNEKIGILKISVDGFGKLP